jgi:hypothetical protein
MGQVIRIPLDLKANFLRDPENFIRDIACIPTESTRPFFKLRDRVRKVENTAYKNPFDENSLVFDDDFLPNTTHLFQRYMHIDLGIKKDAVGISMCYAPHFVTRSINKITAEGNNIEQVRLPYVKFDFLGRIKAGKGEEILISSIRDIIYNIQKRGFYLALITFDGFQSVDSIQILKAHGFRVGRVSIDRTSTKLILDKRAKDGSGVRRESTDGQTLGAMQALKDSCYDERLSMPYHEYWVKEALGAEIDYKRNKVDHKPRGTIDLLQSMAGSVYNLINNEFEYQSDGEDSQEGTTGDSFYDDLEINEDDYYDV